MPKKLVKANPERIAPVCQLFTKCGGCHYQHIPYDGQLGIKKDIFLSILERVFPDAKGKFQGIIASPLPLAYRARARLFPSENLFGFYRLNSRQVQPLKECPVMTDRLNQLLTTLNEWLTGPGKEAWKLLKHVTVENGLLEDWALTLCFKKALGKSQLARLKKLSNLLETPFDIKGNVAVFSKSDKGLCYFLDKELAPAGLYTRATSFFQGNLEQNLNLVKKVTDFTLKTGAKSVMDLFCGSGNFSIPLARKGLKVTGFELDSQAVKDVRENALANQCNDMAVFYEEDLFLRGIEGLGRFDADCLILDPPRVGAKELCRKMGEIGPDNVIYVSCDPMTLSRDLKALKDFGYELQDSVALDMFPQTYHIESITLLKKTR